MHFVKPALTLAILMTSLLYTSALGQALQPDTPATSQTDAAKPANPSKKQADPKAAPTPLKKPIKRRAVQQIIDGMPASAAPPTYGPVLTPRPSSPMTGAQTSAPSGLPSTISPSMSPPPAVMNRCDAGGCLDTNGARYNGASGTLLSPQGKLCSNNGTIVTCI